MKDINHWIELMTKIATNAHINQYRNDGKTPYITHPLAVASMVEDRLKPIAIGHDLIEDTSVTLQDLKDAGFPAYIINAVDDLTHKHNEPNEIYWRRIVKNADAVEVKIKDISHNLGSHPTERAKLKYAKALELFKKAGYG